MAPRRRAERAVTNHPHRGRREVALLPSAPEIRAARDSLGITQAEAASRALVSTRAWIKWESGERPISGAAWALFRLRSRLATLRQIEREGA